MQNSIHYFLCTAVLNTVKQIIFEGHLQVSNMLVAVFTESVSVPTELLAAVSML